jgi:hypothetical protein
VLLFRRIDDAYGQPGFMDTGMNFVITGLDETGGGDGGPGYDDCRKGADKSDPARSWQA